VFLRRANTPTSPSAAASWLAPQPARDQWQKRTSSVSSHEFAAELVTQPGAYGASWPSKASALQRFRTLFGCRRICEGAVRLLSFRLPSLVEFECRWSLEMQMATWHTAPARLHAPALTKQVRRMLYAGEARGSPHAHASCRCRQS